MLRQKGLHEEAEPLYRHALDVRERALGPTHPQTAASLNDLAGLLDWQGKYKEAEPLYHRALGIRERELGSIHQDTMTSRDNLFASLERQCKEAEEEALMTDALKERPLQIRSGPFKGKEDGPSPQEAALSMNKVVLGSHICLNDDLSLLETAKAAALKPIKEKIEEQAEAAAGQFHNRSILSSDWDIATWFMN